MNVSAPVKPVFGVNVKYPSLALVTSSVPLAPISESLVLLGPSRYSRLVRAGRLERRGAHCHGCPRDDLVVRRSDAPSKSATVSVLPAAVV